MTSRVILALILIASFALKLNNLGHRTIKPLDEVFHAIVAANFLKHPLTPTLNDGPTIPVESGDWYNAGIWLHKPPMAMWQIAVSYALLGVNTFALRLPSVILSTLSVWLTFLIGRRLIDDTAGLVAAFLQAFNPAMILIVHGYVFSDHVDVALLFWTELSIYFLLRAMEGGRKSDWVICGVAQGLAFLSKTYPALIVSGLAVVAWVLPNWRVSIRQLLIFIVATIVTILPWTVWALIHWPQLFISENLGILSHLTQDVEGWAAPWDRVVFDYWVRAFYVFYPAILAATIIAIIHARSRRDIKLGLLLAWALGVLLPNLLATSKPMTATLVGWPAMWLLLGYLVSQAIRGDRLSLGVLVISVLYPFLLSASDFSATGFGDSIPMGQAMHQHSWVIWSVSIVLVGGWVLSQFKLDQWDLRIAAVAMLLLAVRWDAMGGYVAVAWRATDRVDDSINFDSLGKFARTLPANAVLLVQEQSKLENKLLQFVADRTCYPVRKDQWQETSEKVWQAGGEPFLVTPDAETLPSIHVDAETLWNVYACPPMQKK